MPIQAVALTERHHVPLVVLSVVIAVLASGAALDFAGRVTATQGRSRMAWLAAGAVVMGLGIWSMHYTGMLALQLPVPTRYHVPTVALSLLAAILASYVALLVASRERLTAVRIALGSLVMGSGIAAMHYIGMAGMRLAAEIQWNHWLVSASVAIAIGVSAVALGLAFRFSHTSSEEWSWRKVGSAVLMGAAIPSMHYTGMAAASFRPSDELVETASTVSISALGGGAIVMGTLLVLAAAIASSVVDRRLSAQALRLQAALTEVKTLRGLLPICATCKRIRTDHGSWEQIEQFVRRNTEAEFSHGMCPDCARVWEQESLA